MGKTATRRRPASSTGPSLALPPDTDRKTKRNLAKLVEIELARAEGRQYGHRPFRWRFHLVPLCWLATACAGMVSRTGHHALVTLLAAVVTVAATVIGTRERSPFSRHYNQGMAAWCSAWALILMGLGLGPWAAIGLIGWGYPSARWVHHYRWRPEVPAAVPDTTVEETWAALCAENKWLADLGTRKPLPGGGGQWPITCDGIKTNIGKITPHRDEVAAAFDATITEAYVEPAPGGKKKRGLLTILPGGSLEQPRLWDGMGPDPATGLAVVGRFPEGAPVHERYFAPGVGGGARHTIIAGCDGSGKTGMIDMGLCISATSPMIAPVILDPQEGQALPAWQEAVPYAAGADECMTWLRGLHAAMYERSRHLGQLRWRHHKSGRLVKGFGFFDYEMIKDARALLGLPPLPFIEITVDEAAVLLAMRGAPALLLDIAKLGRKVGFRLRLALQVPSVAEMAKGELRSILNGGNVFCFRTGDKVTNGMMGIPANPNELPLVWSDGLTPTAGLGFAKTTNGRPSVTMRSDWVDDPYSFAADTAITQPDQAVWDRLTQTIKVTAEALVCIANDAASLELVCGEVKAVLAGRPMSAGSVISGTTSAVGLVSEAIEKLIEDGEITEGKGGLLALAER